MVAWLPENSVEMTSYADIYGHSEVNNIMKATGVERVRIASEDMTSSDMCRKAAEYLISQESIDKSTIDGIVFVSQTCDYLLPSTSICLQERLGLTKDTVCMDVHYGCSGYIYGLFQAALWIHSGACANVLLLTGDTTSRIINEHDKSLRMVFGDCGTATMVTQGSHSMGFHIQSDGSGANRLIVPAGGFRTPVSEQSSALAWDEDQNGRTLNDLYMDGLGLFNFAISNVPKNVNGLLEDMRWDKETVGLFALHQANKFMVDNVRKRLKVPVDKVPVNVANYGNTGPSSIPLLLSDLCSREHGYDLSKVLMSGFGVGLSWGSVAANLSTTKFYVPINS